MAPLHFGSARTTVRIMIAAMVITICGFVSLIKEGYAGTTFYIDFVGGNDTNAGTSTAVPWKTIPGTRNATDTADQSTMWGPPSNPVFSSSRQIPAGTVFKLKSGTTHDSSNGGRIMISSAYYATDATLENPIIIQRDVTWGTGSVTFYGTGITLYDGLKAHTGHGLIHITIGGVNIDGVAGALTLYDGIIIQNATKIGISYYSNSLIEGGTVQHVKFYNCGTLYTSIGDGFAGSGVLYFKYHNGIRVNYCEFDGNYLPTNGLHFGQSYTRVIDCIVSNSIAHNFIGSDPTDEGIGFKAQNSQVTYRYCQSYNNAKGWDSGDEHSDSPWIVTYSLIGCLIYDNSLIGAGFSGNEGVHDGAVSYYLINTLVYDNGVGVKTYAGPYTLYVIHCIFDNNNSPNLLSHPDGIDDTQSIQVYIYNSIFYKPAGAAGNVTVAYWKNSVSLYVLESDYNSYIQLGSEGFSRLGYYGGGSDTYDFVYGANGPGHGSGTWYNWNSWHNDAHSKGTGALDATLPPFKDPSNHNYSLTSQYAGTDLASKAWYIPEMGQDIDGRPRSSWDMGPYEYSSLASPQNLRTIK